MHRALHIAHIVADWLAGLWLIYYGLSTISWGGWIGWRIQGLVLLIVGALLIAGRISAGHRMTPVDAEARRRQQYEQLREEFEGTGA